MLQERLRGEIRGLDLSPREAEILLLIAQDKKGPEIAGMLKISPGTVNNTKRSIMEKLGIHDNQGLIAYAKKEDTVINVAFV